MATVAEKEELARIRDSIKTFRERESELARALGETPDANLAARYEAEDSAASLFERMSGAERMELYRTNKSEWQRIIDAHERAGLRKLGQ